MSLSCSCRDYDFEPGEVIWYSPSNYSELKTSKRRRCNSCNTLIDKGATVGEIRRYRTPKYDVEVQIHGEDEEIKMASKYLCESCCDIFFSLSELGFCDQPWEDQRQLLKEYQEMNK